MELVKIQERDGKKIVATTSRQVAEVFGKRHDDVLRKIQGLKCSEEFTARNFAVSEYADSTGRNLPEYLMTKDGFVFLALGFTGKKAAEFKEKYIAAFNEMEAKLTKPVGSLDALQAIVDSLRLQEQQLAGHTQQLQDSRLTAVQVARIDDAMHARARVLAPADPARRLWIKRQIMSRLKREYLPGKYITGMTWKDIAADRFESALQTVEGWN